MKNIKNINVVIFLSFAFLIIFGGCTHASGEADFIRFSECPSSPNCVSSLADPSDEVHYIKPYIISSTETAVYNELLSYLELLPEVKIADSETNFYIHAVYSSKFFRFKDDVEFRIQKSEGGDVLVDISSRSRTGYSDLGVNRERMEDIREVLK